MTTTNSMGFTLTRTLRATTLGLFCAVGSLACGAQSGGDKVGGETNFLTTCERDSECGSNLCACGVCTKACDKPSACDDISGAVCSSEDERGTRLACGSRVVSPICLPETQMAENDASTVVGTIEDSGVGGAGGAGGAGNTGGAVGFDAAASTGGAVGPGGAPGQGGDVGLRGRVSALCEPRGQGLYAPQTQAEFTETLLGQWLLCSDGSPFGDNSHENALVIDEDGSWKKLYLDESGALTPLGGFDEEGTWSIIDTSEMNGPGFFQLNLNISGSGSILVFPAFTSDPLTMRLDNNAVFQGDYRKLD